MGWEMYRYIKHLMPLAMTVENVPEFKQWGPLDENDRPIKERAGEEFEKWVKALKDLGYEYKETVRNAADDGIPQRRVRYFAYFFRPGIEIVIPSPTHSKTGKNGLLKWNPCRPHINLKDEGYSIFGRQFNTKIRKGQRKPLVHNSLRRIAEGIKKLYPDVHQFLCQYYGGEDTKRFQELDRPINTIPCDNRHQLVTVEKLKFIADHIHSDKFGRLTDPLCVQLISGSFLTQYYGKVQFKDIDRPINTVPCRDIHQLVSIRFEKMQFLALYFNSNGKPGENVYSLEDPLPSVLTEPKHQLVTVLDDFDIKARFLTPEELGACSTFPKGYFTNPDLKLSKKNAIKLIGNAVPPEWAKVLLKPNIGAILNYKQSVNPNYPEAV